MTDTFTHSLATFTVDPIHTTGAARLITSLSMLDWLAVGRAGAAEPVAQITRDMALAEGDAEQAFVFGAARAMPVRAAALVNGTTSHALDYDDTHFAHIGHPSVAVIPAALAIGQLRDLPLVDVLEAALIGMELSIRVGLWLGRDHYQVGFHQTATAGAFGAGAAAGRLLGLDAEKMMHVLGLVTTRAAGLKAQFGTMAKPYNAGQAAAVGVEAAQLVARGFQANPSAMQGAFGYGATHHGEGNTNAALDQLGQIWLFEGVSHKFHACCHGLHAALEAARELDIAAPEIAEMTVTTHPRWMDVCNQPSPDTGLGAKFSYRTVLAMRALGYDTARLDSYSARVCADPMLIALRERINVQADAALPETSSVLEVLRRDGARLRAQHDLQSVMSLAAREERVRNKAVGLIGDGLTNQAWGMLQSGARTAEYARLLCVE
jgi:2-methylcitrate dehydratase PrpD